MWTPAFDAQFFPPNEALAVARFDGPGSIVDPDLPANPNGRIPGTGILIYRLFIPRNAQLGAPETTWRLFVLENYDRANPDLVHPFGGYDAASQTWDERFCPKATRYSDLNGGHLFMASIAHDGVTLPRNFTLAIVSGDDYVAHLSNAQLEILGFGGLSNWTY